MPQITVEYTSNVAREADYRALVLRLHDVVAREIETDIGSCKTRIAEVGEFVVGDGDGFNAFVHITIAILSGRTPAQKAGLSRAALAIFKEALPEGDRPWTIQITVEVRDLDSASYAKHVASASG